MAFKFNALLDFNNKDAIQGMADIAKGWKEMKEGADKLSKGMEKSLKTVALAGAPFAAAIGYGVKQAADFEAQMSLVQGALMATKDEVLPLTNSIRVLGATGKDTNKATEAALRFAQANFEVKDIIQALPSALTLMTAAQIDSKTATDSIVKVLKSFNLEASQSADVVDTLALTATLTDTSVAELADGMRGVAGIARDLGYDFRQSAAAIGILAEGGMDATMAAGALKNAFNTLASPTKTTIALFGGSKKALDQAVFSIVDGKKEFRSLEVVMANLSKVVSKAPDPLKAVAAAADIFGVKGTEAFRKFQSQLLDTTTVSDKNIERLRAGIAISGEDMSVNIGDVIPKLVALRLEIAGAAGSADKIAKINTANARSNFEKLIKVWKSLNMEAGDLVLQSVAPLLKKAADAATVLSVAFQVAMGRIDETTAATMLGENSMKDFLHSAVEFSQGFIEGFKEVKDGVMGAYKAISEFLAPIIGDGAKGSKELGKLAAKIVFIGAIVAPIAATVLGAFALIGAAVTGVTAVVSTLIGLWGFLSGAVTIVSGVFGVLTSVVGAPFLLIAAGIALVVAGIVGVIKRWDDVKAAFRDQGIWEGLKTLVHAFFAGIGDLVVGIITVPLTLAKNAIMGFLGWVLPKLGWLASKIGTLFFGFTPGATDATMTPPTAATLPALNGTPTTMSPGQQGDTAAASANLARENAKNTVIVQPPSAKDIAAETAAAMPAQSSGGGGGQQGPVTLSGTLTTKISGGDLNIMLAKAQISQAEKNGRTVDPGTKRRIQQNGLAYSE